MVILQLMVRSCAKVLLSSSLMETQRVLAVAQSTLESGEKLSNNLCREKHLFSETMSTPRGMQKLISSTWRWNQPHAITRLAWKRKRKVRVCSWKWFQPLAITHLVSSRKKTTHECTNWIGRLKEGPARFSNLITNKPLLANQLILEKLLIIIANQKQLKTSDRYNKCWKTSQATASPLRES